MKKILITVMVLCLLLSSFPAVVLAEQPTDEEIAAGIAAPSDNVSATSNSRAISSGGTVSTQALNLSNGTYYMNNRNCGKYLRYYSSALSLTNGYVSTYGNSIKWKITAVSGGYTISSVSSSTKYLGVPSSTSSNTVELVTVSSGASIPARCIWIFEAAIGGGCLVKNTYNSKYMYTTGSLFYTSEVAGTSGTTTYYSKVWRIITPTALSGKELTDVTIKDIQMYPGNVVTPAITEKVPSSAYWTSSTDFIFTGFSTSYVTFNMGTGKFTASSTQTAFYSATVTATHRVTSVSTTFLVVVNPRALFLNIPATGHDHSTCFTEIESYIIDCGYGDVTQSDGTILKAALEDKLSSKTNAIFVSRSHGGLITNSNGVQVGTGIVTSSSDYNGDLWYRSTTMTSTLDLSNMKLMMFVACKTGAGGVAGPNLLVESLERGAETVIGFTEEINCNKANDWVVDFFELMSEGKTVEEACETLSGKLKYMIGGGLTSVVVVGNESLVLDISE